jgi:hypothetical protein
MPGPEGNEMRSKDKTAKPAKLTALVLLLDSCPKDGHGADYRLCSAGCPHYAGEPRFGAANCTHPDAKTATEKDREARRGAFHAGLTPLAYVGPVGAERIP